MDASIEHARHLRAHESGEVRDLLGNPASVTANTGGIEVDRTLQGAQGRTRTRPPQAEMLNLPASLQ